MKRMPWAHLFERKTVESRIDVARIILVPDDRTQDDPGAILDVEHSNGMFTLYMKNRADGARDQDPIVVALGHGDQVVFDWKGKDKADRDRIPIVNEFVRPGYSDKKTLRNYEMEELVRRFKRIRSCITYWANRMHTTKCKQSKFYPPSTSFDFCKQVGCREAKTALALLNETISDLDLGGDPR